MSWPLLAVCIIPAFLLTLFLTPLTIRLAVALGAIDRPSPRKVHVEPRPRLGGVAVWLGVIVAGTAAYCLGAIGQWWWIAGGATLVLLLGAVDDIRPLTAWTKLAGQVAAASIAALGGIRIEYFSIPFSHDLLVITPALSVALGVAWIVFVTNAINLLDGLDGLAAGVATIAFLASGLISVTQGRPEAAALSFIMAAACLAFLQYNTHPAAVFLGDSGALFVGYMLGVASILTFTKGVTMVTLTSVFFLLCVPIVDTLTTIIRRAAGGRRIVAADRAHLHHRLLDSGLGHTRAVHLVYVLSAVSGGFAIIIGQVPILYYLVTLAVVVVLAVGVASTPLARRLTQGALQSLTKAGLRSELPWENPRPVRHPS